MVYVAIPAMDEAGLAQRLLALNGQTLLPQRVCVCINQPRAYHTDGLPEHERVCKVNENVYSQLQTLRSEGRFLFPLEILDCFSKDKAWDDRHAGVGQARRTAMDFLSSQCGQNPFPTHILVCMDADTHYPDDYIENIQKQFDAFPQAVGLTNPYYHTPEQENLPEVQQMATFHYEVYMRAFALNMILSGHPYAFTAIGSSMACRMKAYRKIGGISPVRSGEDFYFLQKLAKTGPLIVHSDAVSHPSSRLSGRVDFGTGPALRKGMENRWESYPVYPPGLFEKMRCAYAALPGLFESGEPTSALDFWQAAFGADWWVNLRRNSGGRKEQFIRACKEKFDALRSLQFLKANYKQDDKDDWRNICRLYRLLEAAGFEDNRIEVLCGSHSIHSLADLKRQDWKELREYLFLCERRWRSRHPLLSVFQ